MADPVWTFTSTLPLTRLEWEEGVPLITAEHPLWSHGSGEHNEQVKSIRVVPPRNPAPWSIGQGDTLRVTVELVRGES